ncbi:M56 family metallopeptidase [Mycolicibacterium aichiense]|uniref:Integral membrane protein n=1 Tax=Mycolicibacterium aichiense TaxID=1799 RepID=A0AAD1HNU0_9MYCO|nr:M56 family metallopeptidase [Mycolicibacterium aichiense]MCV7019539.1 M48 family metalloprotease [Mycolicibacterium aichiense]BBX08150.1 integral membrane protein [Mycolicibacterium aichiense]STZ81955.1 peptidase M48, Ste24p [Mycolicibacterium aichiense]
MSALAFTLLALMLVGPVPALLARASWPMRAPRAAIVLWQSIAVAAVLSAFSAGLAIASRLFAPGPDGRPTATITSEIEVLGWPLWSAYVVVFAITLLIGARLVIAAVQVAVATRRRRAHHRMVVDLLGDCRHGMHGLRVLDVAEPLAYCLPGVRSRVVLSQGTLSALSDTELTAILSHERAHLRARHDLVLEAFIAVHTAFPRFVRSGSALAAVRLLVEMLADDAAVRTAGPGPLARALVACAAARTPKGALAGGGPTTLIRVRRLAGEPNSLVLSMAAYATAAAVLVVPTVAVAMPWLTELHRLFLS